MIIRPHLHGWPLPYILRGAIVPAVVAWRLASALRIDLRAAPGGRSLPLPLLPRGDVRQ